MDIAAKEFGNPWKPFQSNEPRVLAPLAKIGFSNFCLSALSEWHQNLFPFLLHLNQLRVGKEGKEDLDLKGGSFLSKAHCTRGLNELILIYWTINAQFCLFWMGNRKPRASSNERFFFFSSKMPQDSLEAMPTFSIINPLYFYSKNSWIIPMTFFMLTSSIAKFF